MRGETKACMLHVLCKIYWLYELGGQGEQTKGSAEGKSAEGTEDDGNKRREIMMQQFLNPASLK
jgi:hypothetical protein